MVVAVVAIMFFSSFVATRTRMSSSHVVYNKFNASLFVVATMSTRVVDDATMWLVSYRCCCSMYVAI